MDSIIVWFVGSCVNSSGFAVNFSRCFYFLELGRYCIDLLANHNCYRAALICDAEFMSENVKACELNSWSE